MNLGIRKPVVFSSAGGGTVSADVGAFAIPSSTGNHSVTGLGLQPKAVLFFGNRENIEEGSYVSSGSNEEMSELILGMTDGVSQAALINSDDWTSGDVKLDTSACILCKKGNAGSETIVYKATIVSLDSDGFTVNFSDVEFNDVISFLAIGGNDITGCKIISGSLGIATGDVSFTGAGFTPESMILIGGADLTSTNEIGVGGLGFVSGLTERVAISSQYGDSTATDAGVTGYTNSKACRYQRTNKAYVEIFSDVLRYEADMVSFDSDGFTINLSTAPSFGGTGTPSTLVALCLKGASFKAGSFLQKTSTGNDAKTGIGFQPSALLLATTGKTAGTTPEISYMGWLVGASDGVDEQCVCSASWIEGAEYRSLSTCYALTDDASTATVLAEASVNSFDSDGFTLNYSAADAVAREIMYFAIG